MDSDENAVLRSEQASQVRSLEPYESVVRRTKFAIFLNLDYNCQGIVLEVI